MSVTGSGVRHQFGDCGSEPAIARVHRRAEEQSAFCLTTRAQQFPRFRPTNRTKDNNRDRLDPPTNLPHLGRISRPTSGLMLTFLLWLLLLVVAWPLALLALILYPVVWLLSLPFRLLGFSVKAVLGLVWAVATLPARVLQGPSAIRSA